MIQTAALKLAAWIHHDWENHARVRAYPVPRGGIPALYAVQRYSTFLEEADSPQEADIILDDLIDSGATLSRYSKPCYALFTKDKETPHRYGALAPDDWLVFPWESGETQGAEDIVTRLLQFIGEDAKRGGLVETPKRVLKAWQHWASGYGRNPADILKTFEDGAESVDEMVLVRDIPVYSHCEHHLAPFFGVAHVGYIPNGRIVGLSKLSRLVDIYARRLQVQERLTNQIADALQEHLAPLGIGVVLECRHLCMESRGIQQQGHRTITSAMRGALRESDAARAEFMGMIK